MEEDGIEKSFEVKFHSGLEYKDQIKTQADKMIALRRLYCTFGCGDGPTIAMDSICAYVTSVNFEEDRLVANLKFYNTPIGRVAQTMIKEDCRMELRPKGIGIINENKKERFYTQKDLKKGEVETFIETLTQEQFKKGESKGVDGYIFSCFYLESLNDE